MHIALSRMRGGRPVVRIRSGGGLSPQEEELYEEGEEEAEYE